MEIRTLRYYQAVCDNLSFRKAADQLHISQPSLSASIQKLEEEMDVKLLFRDNKKVMLTREGAAFYREVCEILYKISQAEDRMQDMKRDEKRNLTVAFPSTAGAWLWPELLDGFQKKYPNIRFQIHDLSSYDILRGIERDELEIGYGVLNIERPDEIDVKRIYEDEAKIILSVQDPLAEEETIDLSALEGRRIAMYSTGASYCESAFLSLLEKQGVHVELLYMRQQSSVFNLVVQGLAVAVVLDDIELIRQNPLIAIRRFEPTIRYECGFMWKKNRYLSDSAKKLLDYFS